MEITRTTDIIVETKRRFIVRQSPSREQFLCGQCSGQMITAEASADLFGISRRAIYRLIETAAIHFSETEVRSILVCPDSLIEFFGEELKNNLLTEEI